MVGRVLFSFVFTAAKEVVKKSILSSARNMQSCKAATAEGVKRSFLLLWRYLLTSLRNFEACEMERLKEKRPYS